MTGAELFVASLEAAGIDTLYGVPGEENTAMMLALQASDIDVVLTRHEQAAAFMASVHGRVTGRPAGCFATLGPGATNLVTGVADATLDHVPLVAITAQGSRARLGRSESHQVIDLEALFEPVTKLSHLLIHEDDIAGGVAEAVRVAREPRPGAVHLCLPEDLAGAEVKGAPVELSDVSEPMAAPAQIGSALNILIAAEHPLILAGAGVLRAQAAPQLAALVEQSGIPVATTFMAKGILRPDHPLHLHCVGQPFADHIDDVLAQSDVILAVGFDPIELSPTDLNLSPKAKVLHVSDIPAAIDVGWPLAADLQGAIAPTLRALEAGLKGKTWDLSETVLAVRERVASQRRAEHGAEDGLHPADILRIVEASLDPDDTVLSGVGTHKMEVARYLAAQRPGQVIIPNGLAGMGLALPGAIAAARLSDAGRTLAICGDGEFLMNVQDMETAARLGVSLTVLLWEDGGYGLIKAKQEDDTGTHTDLAFGNPDWDYLARSFGWHHTRVASTKELSTALSVDGHALHLITLPVSYAQALERDDIGLSRDK